MHRGHLKYFKSTFHRAVFKMHSGLCHAEHAWQEQTPMNLVLEWLRGQQKAKIEQSTRNLAQLYSFSPLATSAIFSRAARKKDQVVLLKRAVFHLYSALCQVAAIHGNCGLRCCLDPLWTRLARQKANTCICWAMLNVSCMLQSISSQPFQRAVLKPYVKRHQKGQCFAFQSGSDGNKGKVREPTRIQAQLYLFNTPIISVCVVHCPR